MNYYFPDSHDLVDPSFDFDTEERCDERIRHQDDVYAHEIFDTPAYDGLLVSKGIVDGYGGESGRYSFAQKNRLLRTGARAFFRTERPDGSRLPIMGDCGAFTYVKETVPPYTVDEVIEFYERCGFDLGISVDHVILEYQPRWDSFISGDFVPSNVKERQEITLELANEFFQKSRSAAFVPIGVAQGWSPTSYSSAVAELQKIGFHYIALGGIVPLKSIDILSCLEKIADIRLPETRLHLLGVSRTDQIQTFAQFGVASFDSTSPLRKAFKDERDNYFTKDRTYTAIRIPQVDANVKLQRLIRSGQVSQEQALSLERRCLALFRQYDKEQCSLDQLLAVLCEYDTLYEAEARSRELYKDTLIDQPWKKCPCSICRTLGYHVIMFRGAERNRRRGFHNVWVVYQKLQTIIQKNGVGHNPNKQ